MVGTKMAVGPLALVVTSLLTAGMFSLGTPAFAAPQEADRGNNQHAMDGNRRAREGDSLRLELQAHFTFSGTFAPTHVDTNGDGFTAGVSTDDIRGRLRRGHRTDDGQGPPGLRLTKQTKMVEYTLTNPAAECFRIDEDDFSVEENVYTGPLFELVDPIRTEPVASDPNLVPYRAENWTTFYQVASGEMIFAKITAFQICIENIPEEEGPWPLCHIVWSETIVGGTGRFKHATGQVNLTSIAPTATSNGPAFDHNGVLNLVFPAEGPFLFGPAYGAGDMTVELLTHDGD